jgi:hypothetical protein
MQGPMNPRWNSLVDARGSRRIPYLILIVILLAAGFLPSLLLPTISSGTKPVLDRVAAASQTPMEAAHG